MSSQTRLCHACVDLLEASRCLWSGQHVANSTSICWPLGQKVRLILWNKIKSTSKYSMCLTLVQMYIYWSRHTRNYGSVLLCVGVQCCRKSRSDVSSAVNATAPHDYYWSPVLLTASVSASVSHWLALRGPSLSWLVWHTLLRANTHTYTDTLYLREAHYS